MLTWLVTLVQRFTPRNVRAEPVYCWMCSTVDVVGGVGVIVGTVSDTIITLEAVWYFRVNISTVEDKQNRREI